MSNESVDRNGTFRHEVNFNGYHYTIFYKCFEISLNMPDLENVNRMTLGYDAKRLLNDMGLEYVRIHDRYHYPGQHLLALPGNRWHVDVNSKGRSSTMVIEDVEIMKGRNSRKRSCTPYNDIISFDYMMREKHIKSIGCSAPYLQPAAGVPKCNTKDKIKRSAYDYKTFRTQNYPPCCKRVSKMSTLGESDLRKDGILLLVVYYPEYARIIVQSKDVDIHSLIGNIGGYVGLFLGINIPI